jgi:hypothetical protein
MTCLRSVEHSFLFYISSFLNIFSAGQLECTPNNGQVVKQLLPLGCKYEMKEEAKQNIKKFVERFRYNLNV